MMVYCKKDIIQNVIWPDTMKIDTPKAAFTNTYQGNKQTYFYLQ